MTPAAPGGRAWPDGSGSDDGPAASDVRYPGPPDLLAQPRRRGRARRAVAFAAVLVVGLGGLAVAAVGIAHRLLPRQFTAVQQRQITSWEMERRWRVLSAGQIFPVTVAYTVSGASLNASSGLALRAQLLAISPQTSCSAAVTAPAELVLAQHGCSAVLRATYTDSSGSMVATIAVAVLSGSTAASAALAGLSAESGATPEPGPGGGPVQAFAVGGTSAASFGDADRLLSSAVGAGPYVILSTTGFADDRIGQGLTDKYVAEEMSSFDSGLVVSAQHVLGGQPSAPVCPRAPGC